LETLLDVAIRDGRNNEEACAEVRQWVKDPAGWSDSAERKWYVSSS